MAKFIRNLNNKSYSLQGSERPSILLFAEGNAEAFFLDIWLDRAAYDANDIAVILVGGDRDKLTPHFKKFVEDENFSFVTTFGFFYDAERHSASHTVEFIKRLLQKHRLISPNTKLIAGSQTVGDIKIGIFLSPDNASPGWIEELVKREIESTELVGCMNEFAESVRKVTGETIHSKTFAQAYLGIRQPGLCGTANGFKAAHFDVMHPAYDEVRKVISSLL